MAISNLDDLINENRQNMEEISQRRLDIVNNMSKSNSKKSDGNYETNTDFLKKINQKTSNSRLKETKLRSQFHHRSSSQNNSPSKIGSLFDRINNFNFNLQRVEADESISPNNHDLKPEVSISPNNQALKPDEDIIKPSNTYLEFEESDKNEFDDEIVKNVPLNFGHNSNNIKMINQVKSNNP